MKETTESMRIVKIVAEDWRLDHGNLKLEEAKALKPASCVIVGILINESSDRVVVALEYFKEEDTVRNTVVIPASCILSMVDMKGIMDRVLPPQSREDQSLYDQCVDLLNYIDQDPEQTLIPDGRIRQLKHTLVMMGAIQQKKEKKP